MASRGKGRRRREALALRSSRDLLKRGKSGMAKRLPPPPNAQDGEQLLPRSLKRIMALRQKQGGAQTAANGSMTGRRRGNKFKMMDPAAVSNSIGSVAATGGAAPQPTSRADTSGAQPSGAKAADAQAQGASSTRGGCGGANATASGRGGIGQAARQPRAAGAGSSSKADHLSDRQRARRERLKGKQAKKKAKHKGRGTAAGASDDEDAMERKLMADRNKPRFGEQAMAPLQTSLKRKHWDGGANARHSALFAQQMRLAAARQQPDDAMREQVIKAYRQQKRSAEGGRKGGAAPVATRASLAALTSQHANAVKH